MGLIERNLIVTGKKAKKIKAFFDSGSSFSLVSREVLNEIGYFEKKKVNISLELGDGNKIMFKESVVLRIKLNYNNYFHEFLVGDIPDQMVIGVDFLQKYGHTLEFKNDKIISKNLHLKNHRGKYVL